MERLTSEILVDRLQADGYFEDVAGSGYAEDLRDIPAWAVDGRQGPFAKVDDPEWPDPELSAFIDNPHAEGPLQVIDINGPSPVGVGEGWASATADVIAYYLPVTFHRDRFGIVFVEAGWKQFAARLNLWLTTAIGVDWTALDRRTRAKICMDWTGQVLYMHEFYHHTIESFALRYMAAFPAMYARYHSLVYVPQIGTDDQLEECLADAIMHLNLDTPSKGLGRPADTAWEFSSPPPEDLQHVRSLLEAEYRIAPPGYRMASQHLTSRRFSAAHVRLLNQVVAGSAAPMYSPIGRGASRDLRPIVDLRDEVRVEPDPIPSQSLWKNHSPISIDSAKGLLQRHGFARGTKAERRQGQHGGTYVHPDGRTYDLPSHGRQKDLKPGEASRLVMVLGYRSRVQMHQETGY